MIIFLSELQKEHLNVIHHHSTQVLVDFCKLAIDYLISGGNHKKYSIAADKLNMTLNAIQNIVHALVYLIVEGCKYNLSESDFKSSLALAGFSSEQQDILLKLYNTKKTELSTALNLLQQKDSRYQDLSWRFEIQVASRHNKEEIKPIVSMDFILMTPKIIARINDDNYFKHGEINVSKNISTFHINSTIQHAQAASHCQNIINHVLLQCDLPNLVHLSNKLDQALKESKDQHVRKVQRALK